MGDSVHRYTLRQVGTLQVLSFTMVGTILWSKAKYCGLSPLSVPHRCCFFTLSCLGVEGWFGKFKTLLPTPFNALFLIYGIVIPVLFSLALVKVFLCVDNCSNIFLYFCDNCLRVLFYRFCHARFLSTRHLCTFWFGLFLHHFGWLDFFIISFISILAY
jgi:hypothetical protein